MLNAIGTVENAEPWLRSTMASGERLMGFGHRVYKTEDPRAEELREMARVADPEGFVLSRHVKSWRWLCWKSRSRDVSSIPTSNIIRQL